ncbi:PspA/IM30 family protein [Lyngbya aestuarii]|uniref:PspA/IM30 family protein n=1 Tax=Lyngbya aestuarii TaxID=118322 RepID=UPI00403DC4B5
MAWYGYGCRSSGWRSRLWQQKGNRRWRCFGFRLLSERLGGAGLSSAVGGIGLAFSGTAVGIGMAPVAAVGAVVGLSAYGLNRFLEEIKTTNNPERAIASLEQLKLNIQQEIYSLIASKELIQQQYKQAQTEVNSWHKRAGSAIKKGRDDLARKALQCKLFSQQNATNLKTQLEQLTATTESLKDDLNVIERTFTEI